MRQYLDLQRKILSEGAPQYNERTGQLMIVSAGEQSKYDLRKGFPQCTTKPSVPIRWVAEELFWMLRGERNAKTLDDTGVDIWNPNAFQHFLRQKGLEKRFPKNTPEWNREFERYTEEMRTNPGWNLKDSDLGPVYGAQWRHLGATDTDPGIDQIEKLINGIKENPGSRYHIITAWNPQEIEDMAIGPCHCLAQVTVTGDKDISLNMFQRSCDTYLGVPFNIASYALLTHLIANETGLRPKEFIHSYGNAHIYVGVAPRSDFLNETGNLEELQSRIKKARSSKDFLEIKEWYLNEAPPESSGNERKDHIPFVLEQLSKEPRQLPTIEIANGDFFELIKQPAKKVVKLNGYEPLEWDCKAVMAA